MGKRLTITINMDNEAFTADPDYEAGRILKALANRMLTGGFPDSLPLRDINGNVVGKAETKAVK